MTWSVPPSVFPIALFIYPEFVEITFAFFKPLSRSCNFVMSNTDGDPPMSREKEDLETLHPSLEWKPRKQEYLIMATMAINSLLVALDTTILVSVLPVS